MSHTNHYDLHVTVDDPNKVPKGLLEDYKAVVYSFQDYDAKGEIQHILCARHKGNRMSADYKLKDIAIELEGMGCKVLRRKLEAAPMNTDFLVKDFTPEDVSGYASVYPEPGLYLEMHIAVCVDGVDHRDRDNMVRGLSRVFGAYSSIGIPADEPAIYLTLRAYSDESLAGFHTRGQQCLEFIRKMNRPVLRHALEYALFDDNVQIDKDWLPMPKVDRTKEVHGVTMKSVNMVKHQLGGISGTQLLGMQLEGRRDYSEFILGAKQDEFKSARHQELESMIHKMVDARRLAKEKAYSDHPARKFASKTSKMLFDFNRNFGVMADVHSENPKKV